MILYRKSNPSFTELWAYYRSLINISNSSNFEFLVLILHFYLGFRISPRHPYGPAPSTRPSSTCVSLSPSLVIPYNCIGSPCSEFPSLYSSPSHVSVYLCVLSGWWGPWDWGLSARGNLLSAWVSWGGDWGPSVDLPVGAASDTASHVFLYP